MAFQHSGDIILEACGTAEQRCVWMDAGEAGRLVVGELSSGEVTLAAFDVPEHGHKVVLEGDAIAQLAAALSIRPEHVDTGVRAIFGKQSRHLTDLMDLLDREAIPYSYVADIDGVIFSRPAAEEPPLP